MNGTHPHNLEVLVWAVDMDCHLVQVSAGVHVGPIERLQLGACTER